MSKSKSISIDFERNAVTIHAGYFQTYDVLACVVRGFEIAGYEVTVERPESLVRVMANANLMEDFEGFED